MSECKENPRSLQEGANPSARDPVAAPAGAGHSSVRPREIARSHLLAWAGSLLRLL